MVNWTMWKGDLVRRLCNYMSHTEWSRLKLL